MAGTERGKVVLALCGGGSRGAVEVGFYRALLELRVAIDCVVGSSIGAVNGAFIAAGVPAAQLVDLWRNIRFSDLFAFNWKLLWSPRAAVSLYSNERLRRFLALNLPHRFEDLVLPLTIVGTDLRTGAAVLLERGNLIDAILASVAIPGVLPPVTIAGREIIDGALANNLPLDVAVQIGAQTVLAVRCGCRRPEAPAPRGLLGLIARAFEISLSQKSSCDLQRYRAQTRLVLLEPCLDDNIGLLDFTHGEDLMEVAYQFALSHASELMLAANCRGPYSSTNAE